MRPRPEWEIVGAVRTMDLNGTSVQAFVFCADITGFRPARILSDGRDVLISVESFPEDWRTLDPDQLVGTLRGRAFTELVEG